MGTNSSVIRHENVSQNGDITGSIGNSHLGMETSKMINSIASAIVTTSKFPIFVNEVLFFLLEVEGNTSEAKLQMTFAIESAF